MDVKVARKLGKLRNGETKQVQAGAMKQLEAGATKVQEIFEDSIEPGGHKWDKFVADFFF